MVPDWPWGPHLVMAGFLQRVVNGGGRITREMAIGRKRLDIGIEYGRGRYAVELKMKYASGFGRDSGFHHVGRVGKAN